MDIDIDGNKDKTKSDVESYHNTADARTSTFAYETLWAFHVVLFRHSASVPDVAVPWCDRLL